MAAGGALISEYGKYILAERCVRKYFDGDMLQNRAYVDPLLLYCTTIGLALACAENTIWALIDFDPNDTFLYMLSSILIMTWAHALASYLMGLNLVEREICGQSMPSWQVVRIRFLFDFAFTYLMWWLFVFIEGFGGVSVILILLLLCLLFFLGRQAAKKRKAVKERLVEMELIIRKITHL
eukprot:UN32180